MWTVEEIKEHDYQFLLNFIYDSIILHDKEYETYLYSPKIVVPGTGNSLKDKYISIKLLEDLVNDLAFYSRYQKAIIDDGQTELCLYTVANGDALLKQRISRSEIAYSLQELIEQGKIKLNPESERRALEIIMSASLTALYKDQASLYTINVDNKLYQIDEHILLDALFLEKDNFLKYAEEMSSKLSLSVPEFVYILASYIKHKALEKKYVFPIEVKKRLNEIFEYSFIDYQSINKFTSTREDFREAKINIVLRRKILDDMPEDLSTEEKAIYIYIKLCKVLTYDPEFYAVGQKGMPARRHQNIKRVSSVTPTNNEIVCYEFSTLYGLFLQELGINFQIVAGEKYGEGHSFLQFRSGKYIVTADPTTSLIQSDLFQAKVSQHLSGFICENRNEKSKVEFNQMVEKVFLLMEKERIHGNTGVSKKEKDKFDETLTEYRKTINKNPATVSIAQKIDTILRQVIALRLDYWDAVCYCNFLRIALFTDEEIKNNCNITIIRDSKAEKGKEALPVIIITINENDYYMESENNLYIYYKPPTTLKCLRKEELEMLFEDDVFGYVSIHHEIPGIERKR